MSWKLSLKHAIPPFILNNILLRFPFLYRTKLVNYETNLDSEGIEDLLKQLRMVLELDGNIIECGSSRCGSSIIMANYLRSRNVHKLIYACDSFEGFNRVEFHEERKAGLTGVSDNAFTSTSCEYVRRKIKILEAEDSIVPIKGFFHDTLPHIDSKFCFAFIDCDLRESLVYSAQSVWAHLTNSGRVVFDDYKSEDYQGARQGINAFVDRYKNEISDHGLLNRLYYVHKR